MAPQLNLKTWLGNYVVVEKAGQHGGTVLYVAARKGAEDLYWLLGSDQPLEHLTEHLPRVEFVEHHGTRFAVFPVGAVSLAAIAGLLPVFDLTFIGWRWAGLAESLQPLHAKGQSYQQTNSFALDHFYLNNALQLMPLTSKSTGSMHFPAPEPPDALTPRSDVYSLGAALLMLLGERAPDETVVATRPAQGQLAGRPRVWDVLRRATERDPAKRYPDGHTFAEALAKAAPPPQTIKVERVEPWASRSRGGVFGMIDSTLVTLGPAVLFVVVVIGIFLFIKGSLGWSLDLPSGLFTGRPAVSAPSGGGPRTTFAATPTPLPAGALTFDSFDLNMTANCTAHLNLNMAKGGSVLPGELPLEFDVRANGQALSRVLQVPGETEAYHYQLVFAAGRLCTGGSLYVQAKLEDATQSMTLCYAGPETTGSVTSLDGLSISGAQVNADNYPDLSTYFSVVDGQNVAVSLRRTTHCEVLQDDKPVPDFSFTPADNVGDPVTVALVFDVSGSMNGTPIANARKAAGAFIQQLPAGAPVCVYTFSTLINKLQDCTANHATAAAALDRIVVGGNTALYDTLVRVAGDQRKVGGRQAVVILSDGADTASRTTQKDALAQAQQVNIPVFTIGLTSKDFNGDSLKQIAQVTGASYLETPSSADLDKLYPLIQGLLRSQYTIHFTSVFPDRKNGTLVVRLWDGDKHIDLSHPFFAK